jgi:hypothetical protein
MTDPEDSKIVIRGSVKSRHSRERESGSQYGGSVNEGMHCSKERKDDKRMDRQSLKTNVMRKDRTQAEDSQRKNQQV